MGEAARSYLVVAVEGQEFGFDAARVQTVVEYRDPVPIPGRPARRSRS